MCRLTTMLWVALFLLLSIFTVPGTARGVAFVKVNHAGDEAIHAPVVAVGVSDGGGGSSDGAKRYGRCEGATGHGYARYPGWKLSGDDLFGPLPVHPEGPCVEACSKFGSTCAGAVYSPKARRCALQGLNTAAWEFQRGSQADSTNLIGGCALWSHIVPESMDGVCCLD